MRLKGKIWRIHCLNLFQIVRGFLPMMLMMTPGNDGAGAGGSMDQMPEVPKELLDQLDPDRILNTYGKDVPRLPCALVMCGSGCSVMRVKNVISSMRTSVRE